ncbi:MAG: hypothetical protein QOE81_1179 [Verrucomicrobiota bacterium]|jgi:hypothetical protein
MNKIFAIICISILASPALLAADAKPAPTAPAAPKSKPADESAPVEPKNKSADEASPVAVKNKSSFKIDAGTRSPFWPISWKPTGKVASGGTDQGEVPAGAFVVSTITLDGAARFAIINGKSMGEGQQFGLQVGTQIYQVTVKRIEDGRVILGRRDEEIVVPLRRK